MEIRDSASIDVKLFYLYANSIIDYHEINKKECESCLCYNLSLDESKGVPWLYIDIDGEGTLEIDNERYAIYGNKEVTDGKWIKATKPGIIKLCPSFVGLLGEKNISINKIYLIYFEPSTFNYLIKAKLVNDASKVLKEISSELLKVLNDSLDQIKSVKISGEKLDIALKTQLIKAPWYLISLQDYENIKSISSSNMDYNKLREETKKAEAILEEGLDRLRNKFGPVGILDLISHAHIDFTWLWDTNVTKQKVYRNISNVISLIKNNEYLKYGISNVVYLKWIKDYYPDLYEEVKKYVSENKLILLGGMWVESDTNLPGGESLVRQFLYGQRFLLKEFNKISNIGWLPDSFGFSAQLPQIMKKSGIIGFYTHKLYWNTINKFPYSVFIWRGIDSTDLLSINYPTYGSDLSPNQLVNAWNDHKIKDLPAFLVFGHGDGGGGPTWLMLKRFETYRNFPGLPKLVLVSPETHINLIKNSIDLLPIWNGELYLETHRGVYTNGIELKQLIRENEMNLIQLETWSILLNKEINIENYWLKLLEFEFHDAISATVTNAVYNSIVNELNKMKNEIKEILISMLKELLVDDEKYITFFNYLPWERNEIVETDYPLKGKVCQKYNNKYLTEIKVNPSGYNSYEIGNCSTQVNTEISDDKFIENEYFIIKEEDNKIKIYDKGNKRLAINDIYLTICEDMPKKFDGWDIDESYNRICDHIPLNKLILTEKGLLKSCMTFENNYDSSFIKTRICIYKGKNYIEINHEIDWNENLKIIKAIFEGNIMGQYNNAEIPYGVIDRPTMPSNSWERAKYEVPMWKWTDLYDPDYGISIINVGRQGYNVSKNKLGLSLIRSPLFPNPKLDRGKQNITYWVVPHKNTWRDALIPKIAMEINNPIIYLKGRSNNKSFMEIDPSLIMFGALKKGDNDKIILRLWESYGKNVCPELRLNGFLIIGETNLIETEDNYNNFKTCFNPYEIKTFILKKV
ncbi:alpha-mannosidase [Caldisphaera lagunensis DSM 15908]|uniref:Alpha-mannosidase n=1 Tax=Caldisphaera lagunensis (strain DSM 15908 / JCM 11604 / ANMR 0165 / IC-154) TaxID=1056495 RepID=L0ABK7_CALLD|nr:glycoside hydrolase family 38 C-terminal domain-containing protein [Caldisphaera lagunensis]AFZ71246.1 alpha-mannosidase [Caldisphaera lagunensis DSM 15908]